MLLRRCSGRVLRCCVRQLTVRRHNGDEPRVCESIPVRRAGKRRPRGHLLLPGAVLPSRPAAVYQRGSAWERDGRGQLLRVRGQRPHQLRRSARARQRKRVHLQQEISKQSSNHSRPHSSAADLVCIRTPGFGRGRETHWRPHHTSVCSVGIRAHPRLCTDSADNRARGSDRGQPHSDAVGDERIQL